MSRKKWTSRTLWAFFSIVFLSCAFLGVYVWMYGESNASVQEIVESGKEVPNFYSTAIQNFPIGELITSVGAAVVVFIGGNKARDIFHIRKNGGGNE